MVWQRFAKSPRFACAGSSTAAAANRLLIADRRIQIDFKSAIRIQQSQITGSVAQRNQSATVRRSRSHVQIVPGPPRHCRLLICDWSFTAEELFAPTTNRQSEIKNRK